jgi:hypothetical protein
MRKYLLLFFVSLCTLSNSQVKPLAQHDYIESLQSFFQHPSSTLLIKLVNSVENDTALLNNANGQATILGFLAAAFQKYNNSFDTFQELVNNLHNSKLLEKYCLKLSLSQDTILNWPGHSPSINDLHWGGFFASGDTRYLSKLVSEMEYCDTNDSLLLFLTGASAKWSLSSNANQYIEVKHFLEVAKDTSSNYLRTQIEESLQLTPNELQDKMIEKIKLYKNKSQQVKDDLVAQADFNDNGLQLHIVLIRDKNFFEEWKKPETPKISKVDTYKRGEDVCPIIIFSTDGKDQNGIGDITYDIFIYKPDGKVYGQFKQLKIWDYAPDSLMHLVKQPIIISLEQTDPLGIYKIHLVVHENIKKLDLDFDLAFKVTE